MNRALWLLIGLRYGAAFRRMGRAFKTPRGAALFVIGISVFFLWLVPVLVGGLIRHHTDPQVAVDRAPIYLLGFTVAMAVLSGGKAVSFMPAEVDFFFAGPFSRRELVIYKIVVTSIAAVFIALVMSLWLLPHVQMWLAGAVGLWLAWCFAQSICMLFALVRQAVFQRGGNVAVRIGLMAAMVVPVAGVVLVAARMLEALMQSSDVIADVRQSTIANSVLAPFDVLALTITAPHVYPELLMWGSVSMLMCAVLTALVLRFDGYFVESALEASRKLHVRLTRFRKSGNVLAMGPSAKARFSVPMFPWFGGAGPVVWRQFLAAIRNARGVLLLLLFLAFTLAPSLYFRTKIPGDMVAMVAGPLMAWLVFLMPAMLKFDFRGDVSKMDVLKTLPMRPISIATGQLMGPIIVLTLIQCLVLAVGAILSEKLRGPILVAVAFVPIVNLSVVAIENLLFLIFPTRAEMATPGDFQMVGRQMIMVFLRTLAYVVALGASAAIGAAVYAFTEQLLIPLTAAWLVLAAIGVVLTAGVARAFAAFDPSIHTPPS